MTDIRRGQVRLTASGRAMAVLSIDALNAAGLAIVAEVADDTWTGPRSMLAVRLGEHDTPAGRIVLCWRVNWVAPSRLGEQIGVIGDDTLRRVVAAINAAIEP